MQYSLGGCLRLSTTNLGMVCNDTDMVTKAAFPECGQQGARIPTCAVTPAGEPAHAVRITCHTLLLGSKFGRRKELSMADLSTAGSS
jgi:hypothetical protein